MRQESDKMVKRLIEIISKKIFRTSQKSTLISAVGKATFRKLEIFFKVKSGSDNGPGIKSEQHFIRTRDKHIELVKKQISRRKTEIKYA